MSDKAEFFYKCTDYYHPEDEAGLAWNDPEIGIVWPKLIANNSGTQVYENYFLEVGTKLNISEKDMKRLILKDTFKY